LKIIIIIGKILLIIAGRRNRYQQALKVELKLYWLLIIITLLLRFAHPVIHHDNVPPELTAHF